MRLVRRCSQKKLLATEEKKPILKKNLKGRVSREKSGVRVRESNQHRGVTPRPHIAEGTWVGKVKGGMYQRKEHIKQKIGATP